MSWEGISYEVGTARYKVGFNNDGTIVAIKIDVYQKSGIPITEKFVDSLRALEFIVVDEIHALANKRGTYLSLTLERLNDVSLIEPVRIGLSATISPLEEIAGFLVGAEGGCLIADVKLLKKIDIGLGFPGVNIL